MIRKWCKSYKQDSSSFTNTSTLSEEQKRIKLLEKDLRDIKLKRVIS